MATITVERLKLIRAAIDAALAKVAKEHDLAELRLGPCTYDGAAGNFQFRLEGTAAGGKTKEAAIYEMIRGDSLPPLAWEFAYRGERFKITGANTTGSKVNVERMPDGKGFQFKTPFIRAQYAAAGGAR